MSPFKLFIVTFLFLVYASNLSAAEPPETNPLKALEERVIGAWLGESPCAGNLVFQADGIYHHSNFGPGAGAYEIGKWKIEWNEQPPLLILTPSLTNPTDAKDAQKVELIELNDKQLHFRFMAPYTPRLVEHRRGEISDDVRIRMTILECAVESYFGNAKDGAGIQRPRNLQTLVDRKILPSVSLRDPWGQPFQYDVKGPRNNGNRPDIWTVSKDRKTIIGNWKSKP